MLTILHQDDDLVVINKPHGLLVHPSKIALDAKETALQLVRNQINQYVYPIHRLDRKTSGVLVFALNKKALSLLNKAFQEHEIEKKYFAIVRGYTPKEGSIDYALKNESGKIQEAITHFKRLDQTEIPIPFGMHQTSRYSLVSLYPKTGRHHQLRKHMAHIFHPIIGDRPHGCNKQNKLFKERFGLDKMMLHASEIQFRHPITEKILKIEAPLSHEFKRIKNILWEKSLG